MAVPAMARDIRQNGFKLSLFGFEPAEDFEHLVIEGRADGPTPSAPDQSSRPRKAIAAVPHTGGFRITKESEGYQILRRWIAAGMPNDCEDKDRPQLPAYRSAALAPSDETWRIAAAKGDRPLP